jgi:hypothetical protein
MRCFYLRNLSNLNLLSQLLGDDQYFNEKVYATHIHFTTHPNHIRPLVLESRCDLPFAATSSPHIPSPHCLMRNGREGISHRHLPLPHAPSFLRRAGQCVMAGKESLTATFRHHTPRHSFAAPGSA